MLAIAEAAPPTPLSPALPRPGVAGRTLRGIRALPGLLLRADRLQVVPPLTVVLVMVFPTVVGLPRLLLLGMGLSALLRRSWLSEPSFWFANAAILGIGILERWHSADNHKYLMAYWCVALGCVFLLPEGQRRRALAVNAVLLLGLCMAFATGWKLATPGYRDGGFFRWTLLSDIRFRHLAAAVGGVGLDVRRDNARKLKDLAEGHLHGRQTQSVVLADSPRLRALAAAMTWWTVAIEGALALAFLWPMPGPRREWLRNGLLLLFVATTYAIAPVVPFGMTLILLGIAQDGSGSRRLRAAYLGAALLVLAYALPYQAFLYEILG